MREQHRQDKQAKLGLPWSPHNHFAPFPSFNLDHCDTQTNTMEDEDDDFYDPTDSVPAAQAPNGNQNAPSQPQDTGDAEEEEVEVEDDEVRWWHGRC